MICACSINLDIVDIEKIVKESTSLKSVSKMKAAMEQKAAQKGTLNLARHIEQKEDVNLELIVLTSMVDKML